MSQSDKDLDQRLAELVQAMPEPEWIREMWKHYRRTGKYRPEDVTRVLGDQRIGLSVGEHGPVFPLNKIA